MLNALVALRRFRTRGLPWWVRCASVAALIFATPITRLALTEVVTLLSQDDCDCEDGCEAQGGCTGSCQTCFCCPHSNVEVLAAIDVAAGANCLLPMLLPRDETGAEGHAPPLLRPPAA